MALLAPFAGCEKKTSNFLDIVELTVFKAYAEDSLTKGCIFTYWDDWGRQRYCYAPTFEPSVTTDYSKWDFSPHAESPIVTDFTLWDYEKLDFAHHYDGKVLIYASDKNLSGTDRFKWWYTLDGECIHKDFEFRHRGKQAQNKSDKLWIKKFIGTYPISCSIKPPLLLVPVGGGVSVPVGSPHGVRRRIVHHNVSYPIISQKKLAELADSTITLPKVGSTIKVRRNWNPSMKKGAKVRYAFLY